MGIRRSEELVESEFHENEQGWPTGGFTQMLVPDNQGTPIGLFVHWQNGVVGDDGQNGAFVEDVIEAARQRLMYFQSRPTSRCRENAIALTHLETALAWLDLRTRNRLMAGVENTYDTHEG